MRRRIECHWSLVTAPTQEPVTLDDVKRHAVITQDDDNTLLLAYRAAARQAAEAYLGRALYTQTWKYTQSDWSDELWLPMAAPLQNDSGASPSTAPVVQYYDANDALQTLATTYYTVDTVSEPGRILRAANQVWPALSPDRTGPRVIVTYVAGWTTVDDVPELAKQGIRIAVATGDADRLGESTNKGAEACWEMVGRVSWREPEPSCRY